MPPSIGNPWEFAHTQGDPNGNMSYGQAKAWAENYLKANPNWQGNAVFKVENGKVEPRASWITRNGWVFPVAAATMVAGGGLLAGMGAGGASGTGAATTAGISTPAATTGLTTMPGVASGVGTAGGVGATAGGNIAGGGISNFSLAPGTASGVGTSAGGNILNLGAGQVGANATVNPAGGGSLISKLLNKDTLLEAGRGVGAISQTMANNRGEELDAMMEADKMAMLARDDRRVDEKDIWKKLQAADYMASGGAPERGPVKSASGRDIPQFGFGPQPISQANKDMANTLRAQLMERLNNVPKLSDYGSKMRPGKMETATNWLGPILNVGSKLFGRG